VITKSKVEMWFGFWGKKTYTFSEILGMVDDENDEICIGDGEIVIRDYITKFEKRKFVLYNPYGRKECWTFIEKDQ